MTEPCAKSARAVARTVAPDDHRDDALGAAPIHECKIWIGKYMHVNRLYVMLLVGGNC